MDVKKGFFMFFFNFNFPIVSIFKKTLANNSGYNNMQLKETDV